jgi:hypothetical protein
MRAHGHAQTPINSHQIPSSNRFKLRHLRKSPENSHHRNDFQQLPSDAKYGTYYLSANRLNYGEEESPALLLLWAREKDQWKVIAWAVEVP